MTQISHKGMILPKSPIRKLIPFANAAKEKGIKVYHLNIGQPDIATPQVALDSLRTFHPDHIAYGNSSGEPTYRKKLSDFYKSIGILIEPEELLVTIGGSESISMAFAATLNPGDEVIIPEPYYANYAAFSVQNEVKITTVTSTIESGFALPPISEFEKVITPKTKGIVIVNPNNPTGYLYSKAELEELAVIVKKYDLYLYADEVYRDFCYDGQTHFSTMQLEGLEDNVIMIDSVSKRYSECGVRVGTIATRNKALMEVLVKFAMARLCAPVIGQHVAEASLDTPRSYFEAVHKEYTARRNYLVEALNNIPGVVCPMPKGAFYAVVKFPVDSTETFAKWLLEEYSYEGQTVMIAPAAGFYITPNLGTNEARVAYVLKIEDLKKAVEVLTHALQEYPGRTK